MKYTTGFRLTAWADKAGIALLAVLGSLLYGCSTIDYTRRVDGWPSLTPEVHYVTPQELHARCDKYAPFMEITFACSESFLDQGVCRVWIAGRSQEIEEHELAHCAGYDHPGGQALRTILSKWNESRRSRTAQVSPPADDDDFRHSFN